MRTNQTYKVFLNKETINNNNNKIIGLIITYIHPKHTNSSYNSVATTKPNNPIKK